MKACKGIFVSNPTLVAVPQAFIEMPTMEAAEAMVKAYSETPAKMEDAPLTISMMTTPIDLKYTVSRISLN